MSVLTRFLTSPAWLSGSKRRTAACPKSDAELLDQVLLHWTPDDPFSVRDLMNGGVAIMGRTGSGKTSSSGRWLGESIVRFRPSGGLIVSAKPREDVELWRRIFASAARPDDLLVFSPSQPLRFNFLDYVTRDATETRNVVHCIQVIGESLQSQDGRGGDQEVFWKLQNERLLYHSVEVVRAALGGKVSAPELQRFIAGAATSPAQLNDPQWSAGIHRRYLEAAFNATHGEAASHDFQLAADFWLGEYPNMAEKTRSSIVAGVMGTLHVFNTGVCRTLTSGTTNVTPDDMFNGKWVLIDMSSAEWGNVGTFVSCGWKYLTQRAILKRAAKPTDCINVIWCDEASQTVNSFDATYLSQCRSHMGAMVYLSQGVPGYYAALKGESGEHQANALLGNFAHTIIHASDPTTAEWASKKLGRRRESFFGGSFGPSTDVYDDLFGESKFTGSFNEHYENVVQEGVFINGLRTGGRRNGGICDAIVIKSGEPFACGENWILKGFPQE